MMAECMVRTPPAAGPLGPVPAKHSDSLHREEVTGVKNRPLQRAGEFIRGRETVKTFGWRVNGPPDDGCRSFPDRDQSLCFCLLPHVEGTEGHGGLRRRRQ